MLKRRIVAFLLLLGLALQLASPCAAAPATEASVRELMAMTGAGDLGVQVMQQMMPGLKKLGPELPDAWWDEFMKGVDPDDLVALLVPIYQKHFSEEEIRETIRFYRSPTGRKVIQTLPMVMQESMAAGQQWGQKLARRVLDEAKARQAGSARDH